MTAPSQPRADRGSPPRRPATSVARRGGYVGSLVTSVVLLVLVNTWPGWEAVPFLTADTALVVGAVNASIIARGAADLVNVVLDLPRPRALGDIVSIAFGVVALIRIWQVFPIDVAGTTWEVVARVLLAIGVLGSGIGILEAVTRLVRGRFPRV